MNNSAKDLHSEPLVTILADLVGAIPQIDQVQVASFAYPQPIQERANDLTPKVRARILAVAEDRRRHGGSFWDRLLERTLEDDQELPTALLAAAEYHQSFTNARWSRWLRNDGKLEVALVDAVSSVTDQSFVVMRSNVRLDDGTLAHLPMLDLRLQSSPVHDQPALQLAQWLLPDALLIDSGSSYHVYGRATITPFELVEFLGRALQFSPLVDRRWIAHQLRERCCALRISRGSGHDFAPRLPRSRPSR